MQHFISLHLKLKSELLSFCVSSISADRRSRSIAVRKPSRNEHAKLVLETCLVRSWSKNDNGVRTSRRKHIEYKLRRRVDLGRDGGKTRRSSEKGREGERAQMLARMQEKLQMMRIYNQVDHLCPQLISTGSEFSRSAGENIEFSTTREAEQRET